MKDNERDYKKLQEAEQWLTNIARVATHGPLRLGCDNEQIIVFNNKLDLSQRDLSTIPFRFLRTKSLDLSNAGWDDFSFLPKLIDGNLWLQGSDKRPEWFIPFLFIQVTGEIDVSSECNSDDEEYYPYMWDVKDILNEDRDSMGKMPRELIPGKINELRDIEYVDKRPW
jgi:hypothetical protein